VGDGTRARGRLTLEELRAEVDAGRIDTVLLAIADMQGRLQGKRLAATHFLDEVVEHHAEGCNYLLAVDVDMNTVAGYAMSSWDKRYGDFVFRPDLATLRRIPWHDGTALVMCDLEWEDGSPVVASPRQILRRQLAELAGRGWQALVGKEIFGPVAVVLPFADEAEAVRLANDTIYGLSGSVWTRDGARALRMARAIDTGALSVNSNTSVRVTTPFGGFKQSGVGRELGPHALDHYTEVKNVFIAT